MFTDIDENKRIILGVYKKIKSYYYFEKTMLYNKTKLSLWEESEESMNEAIYQLALFLKSLDSDVPDSIYLQEFYNTVKVKAFPKTFDNTDKLNKQIIRNGNADGGIINKVNFFIDAPIELMILDMIWVLMLGKLVSENHLLIKNVYGNVLDTSHLYDISNPDLIKGINFNSKISFKKYFNQYKKWKDSAFELMQSRYKNGKDSILLAIDVKNYFYNVKFKFSSLNKYIEKDERLELLDPLSRVIEELYKKYTLEIQKYRSDTNANVLEKEYALPIGLLSSCLIANLYLNKFDDEIVSKICPLYYARYVDDIILVVDKTSNKKINIDSVMDNIFVSRAMLSRVDDKTYQINEMSNLQISKDKIKIIYIDHYETRALIDMLVEKTKIGASEYKYLPDVNAKLSTFYDSAYNSSTKENDPTIEELLFTNDKNKAARYLKDFIRVLKNISLNGKDDVEINNRIEQIRRYYNGFEGIEFREAWIDIFTVFILRGLFEKVTEFFFSMKALIDQLKLKKNEIIKDDTILEQIKEALIDELEIAFSISLALCLGKDERKTFKSLLEIHYGKIIKMAESVREANMFNLNLTSYPLISFIYTDGTDYSLLQVELEEINKITANSKKEGKFLNRRKLNLSPIFINYFDFSISYFIDQYTRGGNIFINSIPYFTKNFKQFNDNITTGLLLEETITPKEDLSKKKIHLQQIEVFTSKANEAFGQEIMRVALASIWIDEKEHVLTALMDSKNSLTLSNKRKLYDLLNESVKKRADMIVFPEFYLPIAWLQDISKFAQDNRIIIISGLQYVKSDGHAYNYMVTIQPFSSDMNHRNAVTLIREKNNYSDEEKIGLSNLNLECGSNNISSARIITCNNISWSEMLCFELTSIEYRSELVGKIELLVIPELNRDTNYFANIVESSARDLHSFIIQSNTSKYGDSRITGPYQSHYRNIVQVKGGKEDVMLVADLQVGELIKKRQSYKSELEEKMLLPLKERKDSIREIKSPPACFPKRPRVK